MVSGLFRVYRLDDPALKAIETGSLMLKTKDGNGQEKPVAFFLRPVIDLPVKKNSAIEEHEPSQELRISKLQA